MDSKSKFFLRLFFLLIIFSICTSIYVFLFKSGYIVFMDEESIPEQTDIIGILNLN
ncbi:MAG: hypothetical protein QG594_1104 [Bacteroidota bacterium]|jgi:hypothetical protein|nr:hypothetical protein [Bacteroidota bacterium]